MKKITLLLLFVGTTINAQVTKEISADWTSFSQRLTVESKLKKKFKVEAWVKVLTEDKLAWAGVWARVDNKDKELGFFDNMNNRPIKSNTWETYVVEGTIDSNSEVLNFGGLCLYNGKFYFDNFKLYIENDKGVLELVKMSNNSFEEQVKNGLIPKWDNGTSKEKIVKVKEYEITSIDDKVDGKFSLLLEGKGIKSKEKGKIVSLEASNRHYDFYAGKS